MTSTTKISRPAPARRFPAVQLAAGVVVVALLALGVLIQQAQPTHVESVVVTNPLPYRIEVAVSDGNSTGVIPIGSVGRERDHTFVDVLDQGESWVFHFSSAGVRATDLRLTRGELEAAAWRVAVPQDAARELSGSGVSPSPDPEAGPDPEPAPAN